MPIVVEVGEDTGGGISTSLDLDEVKQHLNMSLSKTVNDTELLRFVAAAEAAVEKLIGPLSATSVTEKHDGGQGSIVLRHPQAASLTSVTYADGTATTLGDFDLDTNTGIVYWNYGTSGYFTAGCRNVTVTYLAGWTTLPADLTHAVKELIRHLWKTQRGAATGAQPGFSDGDDVAPVAGSFSSWPLRVQELLEPYRDVGIA